MFWKHFTAQFNVKLFVILNGLPTVKTIYVRERKGYEELKRKYCGTKLKWMSWKKQLIL